MDPLAATLRTAFAITSPGLEQMPQDVLQHILHYLPIRGARNVFRLLSKGCLASTDYLRIAGLVQARIRSWDASAKQAQVLQRFARLTNDCMDQRLPVATTMSLLMELINLLSTLPVADLPAAMRSVLVSSKLLGERAGREAGEKCMALCISAYQNRSGIDAQLPAFVPIDDEEAVLAARHFSYDIDRTCAGSEELLSHMENMLAAMGWAARAADAEERDRLLIRMCRHGVTTFIILNQAQEEIHDSDCRHRAEALRKTLAQTAMRMLPAQSPLAKAALISVALEVSVNDRASYRAAVSAARRVIRQMPDSLLLANWKTVSKTLFRAGVVNALTQRACTWPELQHRAAMLGQLASAAYDKGALEEMDRLCAMVNELAPPDIGALYEGMDRHVDTVGQERIEFIVRELIPPLIALPPGLCKLKLVLAASKFIFTYYKSDSDLMGEVQLGLELRTCLASYKKLIAATFGISIAGDEQMGCCLSNLAHDLMKEAHAFREDHRIGARATMKSDLIQLLVPLADRFHPTTWGIAKVDKSSNVSLAIAVPAFLEQLSPEVFQKTLHYLPVRTTRDTFRLINRNYLAGTDYLRRAGMLQIRMANRIANASQQQAESRVASLIDDCMNGAFPAALTHTLVLELITTLPQLPAAAHAASMRFVLARCDAIGAQSGQAAGQECMVKCIHAYLRRFEQEAQLTAFAPANDEEARIAVDYFTAMDPSTVPLKQVIRRLENLLFALNWAEGITDLEAGERALVFLFECCAEIFALLDGMPFHLKQGNAWAHLAELKTGFARAALLALPVQSPGVQGTLVSLVLGLSGQPQAMRRQAESDGLALIDETSDAALPARLGWLADKLFHGEVIETLIKRVQCWPEPGARLQMLRQLAMVAWEKGMMERMDKLCADICRLDPPDPAALEALMQANMHRENGDRLEISTRDVFPYLLYATPGPMREAAVRKAALFSMGIPSLNAGFKKQLRSAALYTYALSTLMKLQPGANNRNGTSPERVSDAAAAVRNTAASRTAGTAGPFDYPSVQELLGHPAAQVLTQSVGQLLKQLMPKPGE